MANEIRNIKLGGSSDWSTEGVDNSDVNETNDAIADRFRVALINYMINLDSISEQASDTSTTHITASSLFFDNEDAIFGYVPHKRGVIGYSTTTNWTEYSGTWWTTTNAASLISTTKTNANTITGIAPAWQTIFCETYDEFDDASINTGLWTDGSSGGGSTTESGGNLNVISGAGGTGLITSDNAVLSSTVKYCAIQITSSSISSTVTVSALLIGSGGGSSTIWSRVGTGTTNFVGLIEIFYSPETDWITIYKNGILIDTLDISGLTGNILLRLQAVSSSVSSTISFNWVRKQKPSPSGSETISVSANSGSNFTAATKWQTSAVTSGTGVQIKLVPTGLSSEYYVVRSWAVYQRE